MACNSIAGKTSEMSTKEVGVQKDRTDYRLRERFVTEHGFENFNETEILTTLLSYSDSSGDDLKLACSLLENFGSLKTVFEARPEQLMKIEGMTMEKAGMVSLAIPMIRAWVSSANIEPERIESATGAEKYCKKLLIGERLESFYVIALNCQLRVLGKRKISTGSLTEVNAYPRLVMETALNYNAWSIILCHNHPGGDNHPSPEDISSTVRIKDVLEAVGIHVMDHILVVGDKTYSMMLHGDIPAPFCSGLVKKEESKESSSLKPRKKNKACYRSKEKEVLKMPYNRKAFGIVISRLRLEKGLTQENLSGLAGIARSHLAALENGEKTVKLDTMWRIAEALEISPDELIRKTGEESKKNEGKDQC